MKYHIEKNNCSIKLAAIVERYLNRGWELAGGVSIAMDQGSVLYAQALVARAGCVVLLS